MDIQALTAEEFAHLAYRVLLGREIDPEGLNNCRHLIKAGQFEEKALVRMMIQSPEFQQRQKEGLAFGELLHEARKQWCASLPGFERVLDIGGSSPTMPEGALIELGYRHRPKSISILDLPPEEQYWGKPVYEQGERRLFDWGVVSYIHCGAEKVQQCDELQEKTFGMVYLGQAIEHIEADALPGVLSWSREHLEPEGRLIFDTPNRALTRVQLPDRYIDPDHKYEYEPGEMAEVLAHAGFEVVNSWGLLAMPTTLSSGQFEPEEAYRGELLNRQPESSYVFAMECKVMK